jgi:hypothetical protein
MNRLIARGKRHSGNTDVAEVLSRVTGRLQHESERYFGASHIRIEPVSYTERPFSDVLRIRIEADSAISYAFIKVFKLEDISPGHRERMQNRVARDYAATERSYKGLMACEGLAAVRPIACFPEELAIVTQEAPGHSLENLLKRQAAWRAGSVAWNDLEKIFARIGRWVRAFQSIAISDRQLSLEDMRQYLDVRLEKLVKSGCDWFAESDREQSLRAFDAAACEIERSALVEVPIHGDLSPGNILVDDEKITVLDFTMMKTGAIYHDVSHLYVHIERLKAKPWIRPNVTDALQKTMLRGFDPLTEPHKPLFKLLLLQHTICHLLQLASPSGNPLARLQKRHLRYRDQKYLRALIAGF